MKRLADELVGDVWAVKVAGIEVIDTARHCLAQDSECARSILGRTKHARPGELHRAITEPVDGASAKLRRSSFADVDHGLDQAAGSSGSNRSYSFLTTA